MSDLIRRSDAIEACAYETFECYEARKVIRNLPTADRPRGEWIKHKERTEINGKFIDFFPAEYECSNCGLREAHYFINSKPHNFCPNCGCAMTKE